MISRCDLLVYRQGFGSGGTRWKRMDLHMFMGTFQIFFFFFKSQSHKLPDLYSLSLLSFAFNRFRDKAWLRNSSHIGLIRLF